MSICVRDIFLALTMAAVGAGGCGKSSGNSPSVYERLQSDNPAHRAAAVVEAGWSKDRMAVPLLVNRLEDDEAEVRLYAQMALEEITGETFEYRHYERGRQRQAAVERWRAWLDSAEYAEFAAGGK